MTRYELLPTRNADGTVSLRLVAVGTVERIRRMLRRIARGA
jgi:hypothetical protein